MSHILKRKINNVIYVYQEKSYRDKLGRPRTKQKCLGKLDNNGVLILSKKRNPENLPATITQYKITITKFRIKAITDSRKKQSKPKSHLQPAKNHSITHKFIAASHENNRKFLHKPAIFYEFAQNHDKIYLNLVNAKDSLTKHRDCL